MNFNSYIVKDTNISLTLPLTPANQIYNKKFKAFTLAEVLITLTIIGVVAAMTIPTLLTKHQKQTYVVGLKKAYATISNALQMLPLERGCPAGDFICAEMWSDENGGWVSGKHIEGISFTNKVHAQAYLLSKVLKTQEICINNSTNCSMNNGQPHFTSE